jgi:hypothetical protein
MTEQLDSPTIVIPDGVSLSSDSTVRLPVNFSANGSQISSLVFSVDYDENWFTFDPTDSDQDGIPDAISLNLPLGITPWFSFDTADSDGELDFLIADFSSPLSALPDGELLDITLQVADNLPEEVHVNFSSEPAASYGSTSGQNVPGRSDGGSVTPHIPTAMTLTEVHTTPVSHRWLPALALFGLTVMLGLIWRRS